LLVYAYLNEKEDIIFQQDQYKAIITSFFLFNSKELRLIKEVAYQ
jgi:hypothetical protein